MDEREPLMASSYVADVCGADLVGSHLSTMTPRLNRVEQAIERQPLARAAARGRRRAAVVRGGSAGVVAYTLSPLPALAVQITYIVYSLNTLFTIAPGPVPDDFDSRFDAPGGVPFHLPWAILLPSVIFAGAAVVGIISEEPLRVREHRPFFLGFVWGLGAIYTYGYGIGFIALTPVGNGMLLISGLLAFCSSVSMTVASVKLARQHVSDRRERAHEDDRGPIGDRRQLRRGLLQNSSVEDDDIDVLSAARDES